MISDDWLRWGLSLFAAALMSGVVSLITTSTQIGYIEQRQDSDAAQIREILRIKDDADKLDRDGVRREIQWLQASIDNLREQWQKKFGGLDDLGDGFYVRIADVPDVLPKPETRLIFDDELKEMRGKLDVYIARLKAGKLDDEQRDDMYSLEIDYEIKKGWQVWCETNDTRRAQCWKHILKPNDE